MRFHVSRQWVESSRWPPTFSRQTTGCNSDWGWDWFWSSLVLVIRQWVTQKWENVHINQIKRITENKQTNWFGTKAEVSSGKSQATQARLGWVREKCKSAQKKTNNGRKLDASNLKGKGLGHRCYWPGRREHHRIIYVSIVMFEFSFEFCCHWRSESVSAHWERLLSDCDFLAPARKTTVHLHLHFQMCIEPVSPILSTEVFRSTPEFFLSTPNRTQTRTGPFSIHLAFSVFPHNNTWNWTNNVLFIGHRLNRRGLNPSCDIWLWVGGWLWVG